MKHEIEIPDLPEGWEAVEFRLGEADEPYYDPATKSICRLILASSVGVLIVRKKQPRRIVLEETEEGTDNSRHNHTIYVKGITIDIYSNKLWKIVEDNNKCAE